MHSIEPKVHGVAWKMSQLMFVMSFVLWKSEFKSDINLRQVANVYRLLSISIRAHGFTIKSVWVDTPELLNLTLAQPPCRQHYIAHVSEYSNMLAAYVLVRPFYDMQTRFRSGIDCQKNCDDQGRLAVADNQHAIARLTNEALQWSFTDIVYMTRPLS